MACQPPRVGDGEKAVFWEPSADGKFTVASAYDLLGGSGDESSAKLWKAIWRWKGAQRVCVFLWLAARGSLLTNAVRRRRCMTDSGTCERCLAEVEDIDHILRHCVVAKRVWGDLIPFNRRIGWLQMDFRTWLLQNLTQTPNVNERNSQWAEIFGLACWKLWEARNKAIFQKLLPQPGSLVREVRILADFNSQAEARGLSTRSGAPSKQARIICWRKPQLMQVSLNCDGAMKSDTMRAGAGCLIRDRAGRWLHGCCRHIGICSSLHAELWALADGLELAWSHGYRDVMVQLDCLVALNLIGMTGGAASANSSFVNMIQGLLNRDWRVTVVHIYREGNKCADFLATYALNLIEGIHFLQEPPETMIDLLRADIAGEGNARICPITPDQF